MKAKRMIALALPLALAAGVLAGCSVMKEDAEAEAEAAMSRPADSADDLADGQIYIWHDKENPLEKDAGEGAAATPAEGEPHIFTPVLPFDSKEPGGSQEDPRRVFALADENDENIPTLYDGDALVMRQKENLPDAISLERVYDHGYSVGLSGLVEAADGRWAIVGGTSSIYGVSDARAAAGYIGDGTEAVITSFGGVDLRESDISKAGTIKGLKESSMYDAQLRVGTERVTLSMTADTRLFSSYEAYEIDSYEYVGASLVRLELPAYLKTGYYIAGGRGVFRYVANSTAYTAQTGFNDPAVLYDEDGRVAYDPRETGGKEEDRRSYTNEDEVQGGSSNLTQAAVQVMKGDDVYLDVAFLEPGPDAKPVRIEYYDRNAPAGAKEGTKDAPFSVDVTRDEAAAGRISRRIEGLSPSAWAFDIYNLDGYGKYSASARTTTQMKEAGLLDDGGDASDEGADDKKE